MKWVKCSERMPEDSRDVLLLLDDGSHVIGSKWYLVDNPNVCGFSNISGCLECCDEKFENVTHWMPLPNMPEENITSDQWIELAHARARLADDQEVENE